MLCEMKPTVGSLFAGIGGFDLGFERAGFETAWQVEIDPWCRKVLAKHFPSAERFEDVRTVGKHNLRAVDIICGGFPCQDISNAGLRAGIDGERSGLWSEYARIIGELRPRFVLVENVAALLGRGLGRVLGDLAALGYDAEWEIISAADVGAPHLRERVWVLAYTQGERCGEAGQLRRDKPAQWTAGSGEVLADTLCLGQPGSRQSIDSSHSSPRGEGEKGDAVDVCFGDFWAVEPNVGGSLDGLPLWLDRCIGRGLSYAESRRRGEVLRDVWSGFLSAALWRAAGGLDRISQAEVLFSFVRRYEEGADEARLLVEGQEAPEDFLRGLRARASVGSSPRRPEQGEQLAGEHSDPLQLLPRLLARDGEAPWAFDSWEDAVPRVATGIPQRVDRLRGLGNAVVPQIPELIARRMKEILDGIS